jgi:hypothetical protein
MYQYKEKQPENSFYVLPLINKKYKISNSMSNRLLIN